MVGVDVVGNVAVGVAVVCLVAVAVNVVLGGVAVVCLAAVVAIAVIVIKNHCHMQQSTTYGNDFS